MSHRDAPQPPSSPPAPRRAALALHRSLWAVASSALAPLWLAALHASPRLRLSARERLGRLPPAAARLPAGAPRVLFHAASAGDVRAVVPVARAMLARRPELAIVCTVQTRSGLEMARRLDAPMIVAALPLEGAPWIDRFVAALRPALLVLEYLELWPRLVACVRHHGGQVALQNGRIHPRRFAGYQARRALLLRDILGRLALCTARSPADAERLRALGARCVLAHPHTKHALLAPPIPAALDGLLHGRALEPPVRAAAWIAGAVHADELARVLDAHARLRATLPAPPRLLLCPRYAEHGRLATRHAAARDLTVCRVDDSGCHGPPDASVVVLATTGELARWYGLAAVALVGGTLGRRGGQNPVEAAIAGCRVLVGPNTAQIEPELAWLAGAVEPLAANDAASLARSVAAALARPAAGVGPAATLVEAAQDAVETIADALCERL